jgi:sialidase-1
VPLRSAAPLTLLLCAAAVAGEALFEKNAPFVGGTGGYHTYRLPVLVVTPKGTVLAFADGRKRHAGDLGKIDPVLRRSTDGGRSWLPMQVLATAPGKHTKMGNGTAVVDPTTGSVHFLYCHNLTRAFLLTSTDEGQTFARREITDAFREFDYPWAYFATGHVHGIQLRDGRLVLPVWLNDVPRRSEAKGRMRPGVIVSDDGGTTWHAGGLLPFFDRCNESTVFQAADGRLCLNSRAMTAKYRVIAWSSDRGKTWTQPQVDTSLPCPVCQATTLRLPASDGTSRVLFANPASRTARERMTVRLSTDDGKTWPASRVVQLGRGGYSDLAALPGGTILLLYETGEKRYAERLTLARFNLQWLTGK